MSRHHHRTKMVCTLGPASDDPAILKSLIQAGVDVIRLNASHGSPRVHQERIRLIRSFAKELDQPIAILLDLPGPKFRLGKLAQDSVTLSKGMTVYLSGAPESSDPTVLPLRDSHILKDIRAKEPLYLADGTVRLEVVQRHAKGLVCRVTTSGTVRSGSGLNLPESRLSVKLPTPVDRQWIRFCIEQRIEWLGVSFVRTPEDLQRIRALFKNASFRPWLMAKIEKRQALDHLEAILLEADGAMVARGDLGVETPLEEIALTQKKVIAQANRLGKPVITATQMLESMIDNPTPTRAEVTDIANAVLDGTDAVMLSGETAIGQFPREAAETLSRVLEATERLYPYDTGFARFTDKEREDTPDAICYAACRLATDLKAKLLVLSSPLSAWSFRLARFRANVPIVTLCRTTTDARRLNLGWAVHPVENPSNAGAAWRTVKKWIVERKAASSGDWIVWLDQPTDSVGLGAIRVLRFTP